MFSLPPEVQLDILKYLNFNQLFSFKQTNFYFSNLINKYEGELARMEFNKLSIIDTNQKLNSINLINLQSRIFEFTLNDQIKEKWEAAIDKSIPLFLHNFESTKKFVWITTGNRKPDYILTFPNIPKNIEEMIIIRCWLEQLFNCAFESVYFYKNVFNPEMLNILFYNDQTIPSLQFKNQKAYLSATIETLEIILKFSLDHLSISEFLSINFDDYGITESHTNNLFNILINEGNKFPKIRLGSFRDLNLYYLIVKYILTSKDCSKMVSHIIFGFYTSSTFKLNERAEKVEIKHSHNIKYTNYQIANIHNPEMRFAVCNEECYRGLLFYTNIKKMKE